MKVCSELFVFQEEQTWTAAFVRIYGNMCEVAKMTFDIEPDDEQIFNLIIKKYNEIEYKVHNYQSIKERVSVKDY